MLISRCCLPSFAVVLALTASAASAQTLYQITDLGDLPGGNSISIAYGLNDAGDVVGSGFSSGSFGPEAVLWSGASITNLGDLPGGITQSEAFAISNSGQIVGRGASAASSSRAVSWVLGSTTDLGDLPGGSASAFATDVNATGRVVGESSGSPTNLATRFEGGSVFELGIPVGTSLFPAGSQANGVNQLGVMVGQAAIGSGGANRALAWDASGDVTDIGALYPLLSDSAAANDINDLGVIVGWTGIVASTRAARWIGAVITDLGDLPGGSDFSEAHAINNSGQIVGESSSTGGTHGFLYEGGTMYDLNDLLDPTDPLFGVTEIGPAYDINASGQIVGQANINGFSHAFLLTPVAAPPSVPVGNAPLLLIALMLAAIVSMRMAVRAER